MNRIHRIAYSALAAAALASLVSSASLAANGGGLTPLAGRTSDETIARDLAQLDAVRERLDAASSADVWRVAKAKALLGAASREYQENDRTGFALAAFAEAQALAGQINDLAPVTTRDNVPAGAPLAGSTRVRAELWNTLESLKKAEGFTCAAEALARAEVQLQWAGNEQVDQGDCRTSPHVADAERLLLEARMQAAACAPAPLAVQVAPTPAPAPLQPSEPVAPMATVPTPEELRIPRNVHFALDKFYLSPTSRSVIAGVAAVLEKYPSITVRLEGHTDSRASVNYNLRLSRNRVQSVRTEMLALGIDAARISTAFKGKSELKTVEDSKANFARNRRVEMVFVDSSGLEIKAEDQEEDLQLEGTAPRRRAPATKPPVKRRK